MKLSVSDKELLAKVRRNRAIWRRRRWVLLTVDILGAAVLFVAWRIKLSGFSAPETFADAAIWHPILISGAFMFGAMTGLVIAHWENPTRDLLLRLIDSEDDHVASREGSEGKR